MNVDSFMLITGNLSKNQRQTLRDETTVVRPKNRRLQPSHKIRIILSRGFIDIFSKRADGFHGEQNFLK